MLRLGALALLGVSHGWWNSSAAEAPRTVHGPYAQRLVDFWPGAEDTVRRWEEWFEQAEDWRLQATGPTIDSVLWVVLDSVISAIGWVLFGAAWGNVKSGCRKMIQFSALLGVCLVAHYVWAICYPIVSIIVALVMGLLWVCRKVLACVGTVFFHAQKWAGGAPEAVDVEYHGPGTGKVPDTATLRLFKKGTNDGEKLMVVRRGGQVAVMAIGPDNQSIK